MDERPILPHVASEFLTWMWFNSVRHENSVDLGGELGRVDYWIDERIAFRDPDDDKPRTVLTGESPATSPEAKAALRGGKVLRELRVGLRRSEREFMFTLRGPLLDIQALKLPQVVGGDGEEALYDRMALYEELHFILVAFLSRFAEERTGPDWETSTLPMMRRWVSGVEMEDLLLESKLDALDGVDNAEGTS